jgi:DNA-binding MarR family transcriptional regulator
MFRLYYWPLNNRLTLLYDEAMEPSGLRVTQYHILSELERRAAEPPTVSELAGILTMERSAPGQTLRPLERDGFAALGRDERDGRRRARSANAGRKGRRGSSASLLGQSP